MSTTTFNPGIAYAAYNGRLLAFSIAAFTAFAMSAYFICGYFVGSNHFWLWTGEQWINAIPGLGITFAMTAFQAILYTNKSDSAKWMTILSICVAAGFSVLSEIGQGMERDNIRMESRSIQSPTYQALVGSLSGATRSGGYVPYSHDLQQAQARLATCQKKVAQGVYHDCAESQARVDAVRQMIELSQASMGNRALALAQTAKTMERDENNYHPLVNLIRQQIGVAGIVASFILSLTIIILFEYAFHYLGARYAESRDYLLGHGYDTTRRTRRAPRAIQSANDAVITSPTPAKKSASVLGTHEEQLSMQLPVLQVPVREDDNSENSTVYAQSKGAKVGADVQCPHCGETFKKSNKWHLFCSNNRKPRVDGGNCSDDWHNAQDPARAAVAQAKGRRAAA